MKPQALLLVLLVAALAVAGWFAFRDDQVAAPDPNAASAGAPVDPDATGPAEQAKGAVGAAGQGDTGGQATAADAGARVAAPELEPVTGEQARGRAIRGRVVDAAGEPLAALTVQVLTWPSFSPDAPPVDGPTLRRDPVEVETDAEGRFEARVARERSGNVSLKGGEKLFADEPRFGEASGDHDFGDLLAVGPATLSGVVRDQNGAPVEGVQIEAQRGAMALGTRSSARSAADGTFTVGMLRPGEWTLRTASSRFLPHAESFELEAAEQRKGLVLTLEPGRAIAGRVVDDRGVGVAGMKVASRRKEKVGAVDIERFSGDEAAVTDEYGNFTLSGLDDDAVTVRAYGPGHTSVTQPNVTTGTNGLELRVQRLGVVAGVLVTPDGTPIAGSRVSARRGGGGNGGALALAGGIADVDIPMRGATTRTGDDGSFVLENVEPGIVGVTARGKAHLPAEHNGLRVVPGGRVDSVRLVAEAGATAKVKVLDDDGEPVADATVIVKRAPRRDTPGMRFEMRSTVEADGEVDEGVFFPGRGRLGSAKTGDDGVAVVMGLPAADAVVEATHPDYAASEPLTVVLPERGVVDRSVTVGAPAYVAVDVVRPDGSAEAGARVVLQQQAGAGWKDVDKASADDEGRLRFGPLRAGEYRAALSRGAEARSVGGAMVVIGQGEETIRSSARDVHVPAGETVSVELRVPVLTRFHGRVLGAEGPLADCGLELAEEEDGVPGFGGRQARTDADGRFAFDGVEPGRYTVRFGKQKQIVKATYELVVPPNTPDLERDLTLRTGTVRVSVRSADEAEPVENAEVRLMRDGGGNADEAPRPRRVMMVSMTVDGDGAEESSTMTFGNERALTNGDGVAVFEDVPVGRYTLEVEDRRHAPAEKPDVVVSERQLTDCGTIELKAAGQVRGKVEDADGKPVPMALVEMRPVGADDWERTEMSQGGAYRLRGVAEGTYEVRARALGPQAGEPSEPVEVEVEAGRTKVADLVVK